MIRQTKIAAAWIETIIKGYFEFTKQSAPYHCKVIGTKIGKRKIIVKINNIKNQVAISYTAEELVSNDAMLREFSQTDVRVITFYALNEISEKKAISSFYVIVGQEFENNKTVFVLRNADCNSEIRKYAYELYCEPEVLKKFNFEDL